MTDLIGEWPGGRGCGLAAPIPSQLYAADDTVDERVRELSTASLPPQAAVLTTTEGLSATVTWQLGGTIP